MNRDFCVICNSILNDSIQLNEVLVEQELNKLFFTPFCIEDAQLVHLLSLISAHLVGVLNEKRCKKVRAKRK